MYLYLKRLHAGGYRIYVTGSNANLLSSEIATYLGGNSLEPDKARLLENIVFNHLHRYCDEVYYYKTSNNLEVDFLTKTGGKFQAFQVTYSLSEYEARKRETRALVRCMEETGLRNGTILTYNEQGTEEINGSRIEIQPVWKFLLEGKPAGE